MYEPEPVMPLVAKYSVEKLHPTIVKYVPQLLNHKLIDKPYKQTNFTVNSVDHNKASGQG